MKGIQFGEMHSYHDFSLILSSKNIKPPNPRTHLVEVEGMDGTLDFSEYFGEIRYSNRSLSFSFGTNVEPSGFLKLFSNIQNRLHGKKMKIVLDDDLDFYYYGRLTVSEWKSDGRIGRIVIDADCEPYKYKANKTISTFDVSTSKVVTFSNLRKPVVPKFTTTAQFTIKFGNQTHTIGAGVCEIPTIQFVAGDNIVIFEGSGSVTVEYQEGGL